jgi:hypothetical protein
MYERKNLLSQYGLKVKSELLSRGLTQNWLINEIKKAEPDIYVDSSIITKLFNGQIKKSKLIGIIDDILWREKNERLEHL